MPTSAQPSSNVQNAENWVAETFAGWISFLIEQIPRRFCLNKTISLRILKKVLESQLHHVESEITNSTADSSGCAT